MRIIESCRGHFSGTHKGHEIEIDREPDGRFYIRVWHTKTGCHAYHGWAGEDIRTMKDAKREALYGSCLKERPAIALPGTGGAL